MKKRNSNGAAVCAVISPAEGPPEKIIAILDTSMDDPIWKLPGGSIEDGDIDVIDTAIRELSSEIKFVLQRSEVSLVSEQKRGEKGEYYPYLCVARITNEQLKAIPHEGDENGFTTLIRVMKISEIFKNGGFLPRHVKLLCDAFGVNA